MKTTELIKQAWAKAQGEDYTDGVNSESWNYMFTVANYYIPRWARASGIDWDNLYDPLFEVGTITATDTFDIDTDDIRKLSTESEDYARIVHADGVTYTDYKIVLARQLKQYFNQNAIAKVGSTIKFAKKFTASDPQIGGTLYVPKYGNPDLLKNENSTVPIDDPAWLVCMIAYEVNVHDILRKDTAGGLLDEANEIMDGMKSVNNSAQEVRMNMYDMSGIGGASSGGSLVV